MNRLAAIVLGIVAGLALAMCLLAVPVVISRENQLNGCERGKDDRRVQLDEARDISADPTQSATTRRAKARTAKRLTVRVRQDCRELYPLIP